MTATPRTAARARRALPRVLAILRRALRVELLLYASIGRALVRRPALPPGAAGFGFHAQTLSVLVIFVVLSAVELVVVDLIVHRWPSIRLPLLILGIWGVLWMVGLICNHLMRPHAVGAGGIRVRDGLDMDLALTWEQIASVAVRRESDEPKTPRIIRDDKGVTTLSVRVSDATNIEVELEQSTLLRLPGRGPKGGEHAIDRVRFWADDPQALLREAAQHL